MLFMSVRVKFLLTERSRSRKILYRELISFIKIIRIDVFLSKSITYIFN